MAQRRMFSRKITDTDLFLDMPLEAQALYFHLNMDADDDGFVSSPKKIMRVIGASQDSYKILLAKQFIFEFDTGVCVIKDWKIHNYIQKDRYTKTIYTNELKSLSEDDNKMYTKCIQNGNTGKVSIELGKDSKEIEIEIKKEKKKEIEIPCGVSDELFNKLEEFIQYRKEIKKPLKTNRSLNMMVNNIGKEFKDEYHLIDCIDFAMMNEYQGVKGDYVKYNGVKQVNGVGNDNIKEWLASKGDV